MSSPEHFDRFFVLVAVGLGLALVGGVNVIWGGRSPRRALWAVAGSAAVCALVLAALSTLARGELAVRAAAPLVGVVVAVALVGALLRSGWRHGKAVTVALWGSLAAAGVGLAVFAGVGFDRAESAQVERDTTDLELLLGCQPHQPSSTRAVTDRGAPIVLKEPVELRDGGAMDSSEEKFLRDANLADQVIRRGGPTDRSNCHGWVFTGGKFLLSPDDVELILRDNGYAETHEPQPGDVAVYRRGGAIAHSAVVRYVAEGQPVMVEGKWGRMGVFLHPADRSLYGPECAFYRSGRAGHLLVGVGGASPDPSVTAPLPAE